MDDFGKLFFFGFVAWWLYMATFRTKQFLELDSHMRGNMKEAARGAGKAAGVGMKVLGMFMKK